MSSPSWRVLVADDEPAARRGVRQLLSRFPQFAIVGECRDGWEVLAALDTLAPDVLFLDIQMPEIDGFEVIRRRSPERMPRVVFLTAYDQFAIRAFEADAQDYLLKPVSESRFAATMNRLTRTLSAEHSRNAASIVVPTTHGVVVVPLRDVDVIEAADYYARVWVRDRSYLMRESLDALEERIASHGFARAHRGALVRVTSVRELRATPRRGLIAILENGMRVEVSRRRRRAFAAAVRAVIAL